MWQLILKRKIKRRWLLNFVTILFFLIAFASTTFFVYQVIFSEKIYGGVYVGPHHLGGKTYLEAGEFLQVKIDEFLSKNLEFTAPGKYLSVDLLAIADDPGFSYSLISFETEKAISEAYRIGRGKNLINNMVSSFFLLFSKKNVGLEFNLNEEALLENLKENFSPMESQPKNTGIEVSFKNSDEPYIKIIPERNGRIFDFNKAMEKTKENIRNFEHERTRMALRGIIPEIKSSEVNGSLEGIEKVFEKTPITLKYEKQNWQITRDDLSSMFVFKKNKSDEVVLGLDNKLTEKMDEISEEIDIKPKSAKFVMEDDRVIEFQISKEGQTLDKEGSLKKIEEIVFGRGNEEEVIAANEKKEIELVVRETEPLVTTDSVNTMGIKEIVGVGESSFAWSPKNRRHNIDIGSKKVHGLIIAPGEEFSLNAAIGPVNAATNFKPELVIKGNETKPEYGGGLCQIATTMFRAALDAGLEITERQNHSYRVSYYEPPVGTDATIYGPHPDLRFKNNTDKSLLIQTEIDGDNLKYTLWGTDDSREVEMSKPVMWNITSPPPTKIIETLDLAPGVKKCTEHAHKGASVYFDYKVTFPDEKILEKRFTSYYRPWQEVCLLGVKNLSTTSTVSMADN